MDNFFTYLSSRRVGRSSHGASGHITASWGHQHAPTYRCFELFQQFMHNHGDVQWLSHGPCIVDSLWCRQRPTWQQWRGYMQITRAIPCAFMQIISENISLSHGIICQASERFKMSHLKKPWDVNTLYGANSYQRFISQEVRIRWEIKAQHCFQNSSISQQRTSQMVRRSPTAFEGGYMFYHNIAKNILLVFQLVDSFEPLKVSPNVP